MPLYPAPHGLPDISGTSVETAGALTASTQGTQITSSASANTFGAWTQLLAATAKKAIAIVVEVNQYSTNFGDLRFQIGVGAVASEASILDLIFAFRSSVGIPMKHATFFCEVPAGSRISARLAASLISLSVYAVVHLVELD